MEWIKCSERPPPEDEEFIAYVLVGFYLEGITKDDRERDILTCVWNGSKFIENCHCSGYEHDREYIEVTHWMPLPKEPVSK